VGRIWDSGKQAALVCRPDLPVPVMVAGCEQHPEQILRNAGLQSEFPQVRLLGKQSESQLRQFFGRASMYVATSRYEPFGLAPVEAALSRCALLMNDIPVFRELWGACACYFERNRGADLANKLRLLNASPGLRREYANRAYNRALTMFAAGNMVEQYLDLYRALVPSLALAA
jgi:glycosyltransferase involved in cell wall biosynthesis